MKTIQKSVLMLALLIISGAVMASGGMSVKLVPMNNDKALIEVSNTAQSNFEIEIMNDNNDVIYFKETNSPNDNYAKIYNFSRLSDGDYILTVRNDKVKIEKELEVDKGAVKVMSIEKNMDPYFSYDNKNLKFSYLNFEQNDVKLYLYDQRNNEVVYSANLGTDFQITSGLNLSKLKNGSYEVSIIDDDHVHSYDFFID